MATMRDVARRAGVSTSTVSFVVNGTRPVAPATRLRVEAAMADLGFRRNVLARALASNRTRIVALVFPALEHRLGSTAMSIVTSAAVAASERGFHLVLWPVSTDPHQLEEYVSGGLVDALTLMEVTLDDPRVDVVTRLGVPFGLMGRPQDTDGLSYVDMDFEGAVERGLDHLTELGHRRIALLIGELDSPGLTSYGPIVRTTDAFERGMAARGLTPLLLPAHQTPADGRRAAHRLRSAHPDVTAVLVLNEEAVYGFAGELERTGVRVPQDLSVLALATSPDPISRADPVVSSFVAPGTEMGRLAVAQMLHLLDEPDAPPTQTLVPMELHLAGSTARLADAPASSAPSRKVIR